MKPKDKQGVPYTFHEYLLGVKLNPNDQEFNLLFEIPSLLTMNLAENPLKV